MKWRKFIQDGIEFIVEVGFILIFLYYFGKFILAFIRIGKGC